MRPERNEHITNLFNMEEFTYGELNLWSDFLTTVHILESILPPIDEDGINLYIEPHTEDGPSICTVDGTLDPDTIGTYHHKGAMDDESLQTLWTYMRTRKIVEITLQR